MATLALAALFATPAAAADRPPVACIDGQTTVLRYGDVATCAIDSPGDVDVFTFTGKANEFISIAIGDMTWGCELGLPYPCPAAELYEPGNPVAILSFPAGSSVQTHTLTKNGTFTLRVSESNNDQTESYGVSLERFAPKAATTDVLEFGDAVTGTLDPVADQDVFTFLAAEDAIVTISLSDPTFGCELGLPYPCPTLELYGPDRSLLLTLNASESRNLAIEAEGNYVARIREIGIDQTESYGFGIDCLFSPVGSENCKPIPPTCNGLEATIIGTGGNDTLVGTPGDDVIVGLGGADTIVGNGGNDTVCGGSGSDTLIGGDGADRLLGEDGDDVLLGGAGDDRLSGGTGRDSLFGGAGVDTLLGDAGDDVLDGGTGNDVQNGGTGNDICQSGDTTAPVACELVDPL